AMIAGRDEIRLVLDGRQRVRDGRGELAEPQERVVILGVADADDVVRRDREALERSLEAGRLVDAGRQDHDRALVEYDLQLEPVVADRLEHRRRMRLPGRDDGL